MTLIKWSLVVNKIISAPSNTIISYSGYDCKKTIAVGFPESSPPIFGHGMSCIMKHEKRSIKKHLFTFPVFDIMPDKVLI